MASHLEDLPPEVLTAICWYIKAREPVSAWQYKVYRTLSRFSRVSKSINEWAVPVLYHTFENETYPRQPRDHFFKFMRAIVRNPGLGLHVRKLSISVWDKPSYTIAKTIDDCPKFEFAEFDKIIRTVDPISYLSGTQEGKVYVKKAGYAGVDPRPGLEELFYRQNYMEDAYVALLLSKVPNLQELTYGSGRCKASSRQIWTLVEEAVRDPRVGAFPKLQDVSISYPNKDASLGVNLWEILDLFWGPALRKFHATKCYWLGPSTLKSNASTIHTIDLENCEFPPKAVAHLLAHCKGLKTFNVSYDLYRTGLAKATGVVHALRLTQSMSLETLKIVYSDDPDRKPVYSFSPPDLPTPCSLHGLPNLKHLIFGQLPLLGLLYKDVIENPDGPHTQSTAKLIDLLPPSLEKLEIVQCDPRIERHLRELDSRGEKLPKLTSIRVEKAFNWGWDPNLSMISVATTFVPYRAPVMVENRWTGEVTWE